MKKPNVIFILSDQHSAKLTGYNGHPIVKTPNLDRLSQEGVTFDNAITQNPICTPSRISWLSGQYCHNHGYYGGAGPNPHGLPTILGHFRRFGYKTAAIGKIHCPEYWVEDDCDMFIEARNCSIGGSPEFKEHLKKLGYECDPDSIYTTSKGQCLDGKPSVIDYDNSQEKFIVNKMIDFIEKSVDDEKPFIVHTSFGKPHQPYVPSKEFWVLYSEDEIEMPPNFNYSLEEGGKAPNLIKTANAFKSGDWTEFAPKDYSSGAKRKLRGYLGCISQVDRAVGDIMQYLKDKNLEEDTIIIYSSDHGDYACEHGIMEKAPGICSDAITRIPCLWRWTNNFKSGYRAKEIIETVDLPATLCSLCGLEQLETSDGKDISALLYGEEEIIHEIGVTEFVWSKSVRKGKYRFVYYPKEMFLDKYPDGFGELYDLEKDPWEMENLYFNEKYSKVIKDLKDNLMDWLITTTRPRTNLHASIQAGDQTITRYHNTINRDGKINPKMLENGSNYI